MRILFFGRKDCNYTKKLKIFLQKKDKKLIFFESKKLKEKINIRRIKNMKFDYIICYRSYYIINKNLLKKCRNLAINFHPGLPEFRGIGCANFALYKNSKYYGSTAHIITNQIDFGPILNVKKFRIPDNYGVDECLEKTYQIMYLQAKKVLNDILRKNKKYSYNKKNEKLWSKKITKKKDLNNLYQLNPNIKKDKFYKILRATVTKKFRPYVKIYDKKFILES